MYRKLLVIGVVVCFLAASAFGGWTYTFDCDQVISGYNQTGANGSPWRMDVYDTAMTNAWAVSSGIATIIGTDLASNSDGAVIKIAPKALDGSDGLAHTIDVRAARPGNSWSSVTSGWGLGFMVSVPVNTSSCKKYHVTLGNLSDVTDLDRIRVCIWPGPTTYDFDVAGLNVSNFNRYRMGFSRCLYFS